MKTKYLVSGDPLTQLVLSKAPLLAKTRFDIYHAKLAIVEFLTLIHEHKGNVEEFLEANFFLEEDNKKPMIIFMEAIVDDLSIYCPELMNIVQHNNRLDIVGYDNRAFILGR